MKQIKIGKKYVTRCGRYVFKTVDVAGYGGLIHTECCKILDNKAGGVTWSIGEKTTHYAAGNWRVSRSANEPDLVKRYRKGKPVEKVVAQQFSDGHARLGVKITAADVGREVLLRNGERGQISSVENRTVWYKHESATRSASLYGSWYCSRDIDYTSISELDIVSFVK